MYVKEVLQPKEQRRMWSISKSCWLYFQSKPSIQPHLPASHTSTQFQATILPHLNYFNSFLISCNNLPASTLPCPKFLIYTAASGILLKGNQAALLFSKLTQYIPITLRRKIKLCHDLQDLQDLQSGPSLRPQPHFLPFSLAHSFPAVKVFVMQSLFLPGGSSQQLFALLGKLFPEIIT